MMNTKGARIVGIIIDIVLVAAFGLLVVRHALYGVKLAREQRAETSHLERKLAHWEAKHAGWLEHKKQLVKQGEELQRLREENEELRQVLARSQTDKPAP